MAMTLPSFPHQHQQSHNRKLAMVSFFLIVAALVRLETVTGFCVGPASLVHPRGGKRSGGTVEPVERWLGDGSPGALFSSSFTTTTTISMASRSPRVWIEEAEEGFVDEEENLEPGEVCLRSLKSFASGVRRSAEAGGPAAPGAPAASLCLEFGPWGENDDRRFLTAGALVRRPDSCGEEKGSESHPTGICDAWMADARLDEGGPNLQLRGALLVLDDLLLCHLRRARELHQRRLQTEGQETLAHHLGVPETDPPTDDSWAILALRNFVVHCGDDDDDETSSSDPSWRSTSHVAASEMAASMRGFVPLRELTRRSSVYDHAHYYDGDVTGLVLDPWRGVERYREAAQADARHGPGDTRAATAAAILDLLPSSDTVARHTTKRFVSPGPPENSE